MFVLCLAQRGSLGVIFIAVLNNSVYRFLEVGGKGLAVGPVGTLKCDFVDYPYSRSCNTGDVVCLCSLVWLHPPPVLPLCGVLVLGRSEWMFSVMDVFTGNIHIWFG